MNALKQLLASPDHICDKVPVIPIIGQYAAMRSKQSMKNIAWDAELMAEVVLDSLEHHQYDLCNPITDPTIGIENSGSHICIHEWKSPEIIEYAVKSFTDIKNLPTPDPYNGGRMPVIIKCEDILNQKYGDRTCISGMISGVLTYAAFLRGPQYLFYDITDHPSEVHELLKYSLDTVIKYAEAQIVSGGVRLIQIFDPSSKLVENSGLEEFSFSYLKQLVDSIKSMSSIVMLNACEGSVRMINQYIEIGIDILNISGNIDLTMAKNIISDRAILAGNIPAENLMIQSSEEIFAESCRCIEKAAVGGKFILSSSREIPIITPSENIDAMVKAAHEFGADFIRYAKSDNSIEK